MRCLFIFILTTFLITSFCYAGNFGRVCLEKSTGKLIEFQTGDEPLGKLTRNAENSVKPDNTTYKKEDVIEKYVTAEEWKVIKEEQIDKPIRDLAKQKELERLAKEQAIKIKLNLTDEDFINLKEALK